METSDIEERLPSNWCEQENSRREQVLANVTASVLLYEEPVERISLKDSVEGSLCSYCIKCDGIDVDRKCLVF